MIEKQNLRPKEVAKYLGIGLSTVYLYCREGKLNPIKLSTRVTVFKKDELDEFINKGLAV